MLSLDSPTLPRKSLAQIGDEVLRMFNTDRKAKQAFRRPCPGAPPPSRHNPSLARRWLNAGAHLQPAHRWTRAAGGQVQTLVSPRLEPRIS